MNTYPFLLGQSLTEGVQEFLTDEDLGKPLYVIMFKPDKVITFRGTLESYNYESRSVVLRPCTIVNPDGTTTVLPDKNSFNGGIGHQFPTMDYGHGYTFRAARATVPSLYNLAFTAAARNDPSFHDDPVVPMGGKRKSRKSRKRK